MVGRIARRVLTPDWAKSDDGGLLSQLKDAWEALNSPLVTFEELEEIGEERYVPIGDDGWSKVHPEFEQFDDPLGFLIDLLTGGLWDFELELHIAWNDCEIFISVEGKISIYETSADKNSGGGISYRRNTPECQRPEPPPPPPPPPIPPAPGLPKPGSICCEPRPHTSSINYWLTYSGSGCAGSAVEESYQTDRVAIPTNKCWYLIERNATYIQNRWPANYTTVRRTLLWVALPANRNLWPQTISSFQSRTTLSGLGVFTSSATYYGVSSCYQKGILVGKVAPWQKSERQTKYNFADGLPSCLNGELPPPPPPPPPPKTPPPPHNDEDDDMRCCKNSKDSEELLKKIARAVGVNDLPLSTPKSFIRGSDSYTKLKSLVQIQNHILEQIDAVTGEFPIEIEIKDADPTKKGNQKKKIKLPNIAESLAEMYGLIFETDSYVGAIVDYVTRLAVETLSIKAGVAKNLAYHQAITEFLGFRTNFRYKTIKTAFDPWRVKNTEKGAKRSQMFLEYVVNSDRDTLMDYLPKLMYSASIIKNVFMKDKDDLEKWKKQAADAEKKLKEQKKKKEEELDPDEIWDEFVKYLNRDGFVNRTPGSVEPKAREIPIQNPNSPNND